MIKSTELMIGNWYVGYDNELYQWTVKEWIAISDGVSVDEIIKRPVELTPQILEKCGFVEDEYVQWRLNGGFQFPLTHEKPYRIILHNDYSSVFSFIVSEIIDGGFLLEDDNLNELASKDTLEEAKEAAQQIHEKNLIDNYLKEVR